MRAATTAAPPAAGATSCPALQPSQPRPSPAASCQQERSRAVGRRTSGWLEGRARPRGAAHQQLAGGGQAAQPAVAAVVVAAGGLRAEGQGQEAEGQGLRRHGAATLKKARARGATGGARLALRGGGGWAGGRGAMGPACPHPAPRGFSGARPALVRRAHITGRVARTGIARHRGARGGRAPDLGVAPAFSPCSDPHLQPGRHCRRAMQGACGHAAGRGWALGAPMPGLGGIGDLAGRVASAALAVQRRIGFLEGARTRGGVFHRGAGPGRRLTGVKGHPSARNRPPP